MSGNMSFLNDNRGTVGSAAFSSMSRQNGVNSRNQATGSFLSRGGGGGGGASRGSLSFAEGNSTLGSFVEDPDDNPNFEGLCDKDVWANRIVLSALEDAVFTEVPYPKLPPKVIKDLQKFLLSVNAASSNCNSFVEYEKSMNTSIAAELAEDDPNVSVSVTLNRSGRRSGGGGPAIPKVETSSELVEGLTRETRVVLRSLVKAYIRRQTVKIREFWKPILEMNGVAVPEIPANLPQGPRRSMGVGGSEGDLKGLFDAILSETKAIQVKSLEADADLQMVLKRRDEEMSKYERDIKKFKEITLESLKELKLQEEPEFVQKYLEYLNLENECVEQQKRVEDLRGEEEERGSEEEQKKRQEMFNKLNAEYEKMVKENEEMEEKNEKYKSLGPEFATMVAEYNEVEENIKLKEWVEEQLKNGPNDESLLGDSFGE